MYKLFSYAVSPSKEVMYVPGNEKQVVFHLDKQVKRNKSKYIHALDGPTRYTGWTDEGWKQFDDIFQHVKIINSIK